MLRQSRERREWEKATDELDDLEVGFVKRFRARAMAEREVMIVEIPIVSGRVLDVRLERDHEPTGTKHAPHFFQESIERGFAREMLEKVTGEAQVDFVVANELEPRRVGSMELDARR